MATVPATGPIAVGISEVPTSGVLGALQGPENVVSIRTRRYDDYPLIVVGPGAGIWERTRGRRGRVTSTTLKHTGPDSFAT